MTVTITEFDDDLKALYAARDRNGANYRLEACLFQIMRQNERIIKLLSAQKTPAASLEIK